MSMVFKFPDVGEGIHEGKVVKWLVNEGESIQTDQPLVKVETDKAIMDVEVFREGYLSGPIAAVDSTVAVGDAIAYIVAAADEVQQGEAGVAATAAEPAPQAAAVAASESAGEQQAPVVEAAEPEGAECG